MKTKIAVLFFMAISWGVAAQEMDKKQTADPALIKVMDSLYREDQFYFSLAYNLVQSKPANYSQSGFSQSFSGGFLRDFPVNKTRTFGFAVGIGYAFTNIKHNLKVLPAPNQNLFVVFSDGTPNKDKLELQALEVPLEIRWRTSVPQSHKFWRVYTGIKVSYLFRSRAIYENNDEAYKVTNLKEVNTFQYSMYIAAGYNTWNFYANYGLNPIFDAQTLNGEALKLKSLNLGLMFYIL